MRGRVRGRERKGRGRVNIAFVFLKGGAGGIFLYPALPLLITVDNC